MIEYKGYTGTFEDDEEYEFFAGQTRETVSASRVVR